MRDLDRFRAAVREHRRVVGRTQQQLARSVGLHPDMLSHKLNGSDHAMLTAPDVIGIVTTLAGWGALANRAEVHALLGLMDVPPHAVAAQPRRLANDRAHRRANDAAHRRAAGQPRPSGSGCGPRRCPPRLLRWWAANASAPRWRWRWRARLVTLTEGAGGTGKTRLATQVARDLAGDFADGVAFVDLAPVHHPALFATTIARTLGLVPASAEAAEAHLVEALHARELLLVTDNLEHLLEETQLLARMMAAIPGLRLLATSRIALRLYGEQTVRVSPLPLPGEGSAGTAVCDSEAVQLFMARARAVRPDFDPQAGELAAVGEIPDRGRPAAGHRTGGGQDPAALTVGAAVAAAISPGLADRRPARPAAPAADAASGPRPEELRPAFSRRAAAVRPRRGAGGAVRRRRRCGRGQRGTGSGGDAGSAGRPGGPEPARGHCRRRTGVPDAADGAGVLAGPAGRKRRRRRRPGTGIWRTSWPWRRPRATA